MKLILFSLETTNKRKSKSDASILLYEISIIDAYVKVT